MFEYINSLDKPITIEVMESSIEIDRIISDYITESSLLPLLDVYLESEDEAAQAGRSKFSAAIHKIVEKIKSIVNKMIESFKDIFAREDITADQYFDDPNVKIQLNQDFVKMQAEIEEEQLKGRKYIQMISKGLHVDDHLVAAFVDKAANIGTKYGKYIITGGAAFIAAKKFSDSAKKSKDDLVYNEKLLDKTLVAESKKIKRMRTDAKQQEKLKNHPNILKGVQGATSLERQAMDILGGLGKLTTKSAGNAMKLYSYMANAKNKLG